MRILAAVVTHNRLSLVQRCYQKIKDQSYLPSEILIIDNDSNDGTQEYFKSINCSYIRQSNSGSSGGWNTAIAYALKINLMQYG